MANQASEVRTIQEARTVRRIPAGAILALAMAGITERGPVDSVSLCLDFPEWQAVYGSWTTTSVINEARAFYDNGGSRLYQSRIVHHTDVTDPTTKASAAATDNVTTSAQGATYGTVLASVAAPYALVDGDDLDFSVNGGATDTATFNAAAAEEESGSSETYDLSSGGETLTVKIDQGTTQTITFQTSMFGTPASATAEEVAAAINGQLVGGWADASSGGTKVQIWSDTIGTGSYVQITGGTANSGILDFPTSEIQGTGDAVDASAITIAELKTLIEGDVSGVTVSDASGYLQVRTNTAGASGSIQVEASSTADDELGLDNAQHDGADASQPDTLQVDAKYDGAYGNELSIQISDASSGESDEFNLAVIRNSVAVETFYNCSMTDTDANFVEKVINDGVAGQGPSNLITVTDLDCGLTSPDDRPINGTHGPLTGGDDGLTSIADADYVGGTGTNGQTGLRTFDAYDVDVLVVPGQSTSTVHNGMVTYCDITREGLVFAVLDPPAGLTAQEMVTYVVTTAALFGLTENAAIYWPRVKITNPSTTVYGDTTTITVGACGHVAGVMARVDAAKIGGSFDQPAGTDNPYLPRGIVDFEDDPNGAARHEVTQKPKRELVFPKNINPISQESGTQIFIDGARNLDIAGNWPSIGQRRGVMFVEKRLIPGLAFMRHRNIRPKLYNDGKLTVETFLTALTGAGAFASDKPSEAFSVDFGEGLNPASVQLQRMVKARVGLATSVPAEFIQILIGPDNTALEAELAALAA